MSPWWLSDDSLNLYLQWASTKQRIDLFLSSAYQHKLVIPVQKVDGAPCYISTKLLVLLKWMEHLATSRNISAAARGLLLLADRVKSLRAVNPEFGQPRTVNLRTASHAQKQTRVAVIPAQKQTRVAAIPAQKQTQESVIPAQKQTQESVMPAQKQTQGSVIPAQAGIQTV